MGLFNLFKKKVSTAQPPTKNSQPYKRMIHSAGTHIMGELYEEVKVKFVTASIIIQHCL